MNTIYPANGTASTTYLPNKTLSIPRYMDVYYQAKPQKGRKKKTIGKEQGMAHRLAELEVEVEFG
jgi:hypothetical protein